MLKTITVTSASIMAITLSLNSVSLGATQKGAPVINAYQYEQSVSSNDFMRQKMSAMAKEIKDLQSQMQALTGKLAQQANELKKLKSSNHYRPVQTAQTNSVQLQNDLSSYESAYKLVQSKQYATAVNALQQYLQTFPQGKYRPNAYYWLGEVLYAENNALKAVHSFKKVVELYPTSNKAAPALYKLALIEYDSGEFEVTRQKLKAIISKYPTSKASELARLKLRKMNTNATNSFQSSQSHASNH